MADLPGYMRLCLQSGKLAFLAILVSGGIVLQILVGNLPSHLFCLHKSNVIVKLFFVPRSLSIVRSHMLCIVRQACALYNNWWPMLTGR